MRAAYLDLDGTLLGPGGSLLRGARGGFCEAGVRALRLLHERRVATVLVSGRSRARLESAARILGADGVLPELGALDAGYPTRPGESVHAAIAATGVPARLLAREPGLETHPAARWGREGSHVLRGLAGPGAAEFVERESGGALRLVDNGRAGWDGSRVYHVVPAGAGKASAVARDAAERGVPAGACLAVGDSREDLEMGRCLGAVAIVANGARHDPALAAEAPWVTRAAHGAGVLEAVEEWLAAAAPPAAAAAPAS